MSSYFQQGWQEQNVNDEMNNENVASKFVSKDKPLGILQSTKHSLQPDMLFGWRPKLPSCPLPLKFPNPQTSKIIQLISQSDLYRIAYKNKHFVSSVQVNQKYDYYWKYRARYSLNLALIEQASKQQQKQQKYFQSQQHEKQPCQYQFSADFQSANLDFAIRIKPKEYDCFLRSDSNTKGHCNWYYFSVKNNNNIGQIKISICNIGKTKNLYNKGMKPYVREMFFQSEDKQNQTQDWSQQQCYNVEFVQRICRYGTDTKRFQLQFKYNFSKPNMEVFFAYAIPYTYSKLEKFIKQVSTNPQFSNILVMQKMCQSLGGLNIPLLKITNNVTKQNQIEMHKKAVILSARIHPGESHSSYVIQGLIKQLLKAQENIEKLRQNFIFYIVPMLNVDGVVVGNYRTSYSGKDLNRQFKNLDPYVFPQIQRLHQLALEVRQRHFRGIEFYMDFHGHSSKKNLFAYGPQHSVKNIYYFKCRIFPKLIENIHPIFSFKNSNFKISQGKKTTARAHMLWKLKIPMVYTFEVSNGMYETKNKQDILLTENILLEAGQAILKAFYKYVRLEMGIPAKVLSKKVNFIQNNKENVKRRIIKSSKGLRDSSIGASSKKRISKNGQNYISEKLLIEKGRYISSTKKQLNHLQEVDQIQQIDQQQQLDEQTCENLQEFMDLINDVKNTKFSVDIEGGSDSQSEGEDMQKQDIQKLYKNIKETKLLKELKAKKKPNHRFSRQQKSKPKKSPNEQSTTNNIFTEIKKQLKKFKSYQLEQLIKQSKKLNNQMSYVTLPTNKTQTLTKSPSVGDKLARISARLYNGGSNLRDNLHVEKQKVIKIPLMQKKFDIDL